MGGGEGRGEEGRRREGEKRERENYHSVDMMLLMTVHNVLMKMLVSVLSDPLVYYNVLCICN